MLNKKVWKEYIEETNKKKKKYKLVRTKAMYLKFTEEELNEVKSTFQKTGLKNADALLKIIRILKDLEELEFFEGA